MLLTTTNFNEQSNYPSSLNPTVSLQDQMSVKSLLYPPCLAKKSASVMGQACNSSPTGALILTGNLLDCVLK